MRPHLTYANVVSTICLFIVLGGSAVAAGLITGKDVKNGSLTGKDVKNKSLTRKDFKGSVRGPQGPAGQNGSPDTGAQVRDKLATVDGAGSGIDADMLDGLSSNAFEPAGHVVTAPNSIVNDTNTQTVLSADGISLINDCSDGVNAKAVLRMNTGNAGNVVASVATDTTLTVDGTTVDGNASPPANGVTIAETTGRTRGDFNVAQTTGPNASKTIHGSFYLLKVFGGCQVAGFAIAG